MRRNMQGDRWELPAIPTGPYAMPPCFSIVVPCGEDRENLVLNPSFELDANDWSAIGFFTFDRSTAHAFSGAYSATILPTATTQGVWSGQTTPMALTPGVYAISAYFLGTTGGIPYDFYIATTAPTRLQGVTFNTTGLWQRVTFMYTELSTANRTLVVVANSSRALNRTLYMDAFQVERCGTNKYFPTTYIDGDQLSFEGDSLSAYYWTGTPHLSTSVRQAFTRHGGRVVNLRDQGLQLSATAGLGLAIPTNDSIPNTNPGFDGEAYTNTYKEARSFSLAGRVTGRSLVQLDQMLGAVSRYLDVDSGQRRSQIVMKYQPMDEDEIPTGSEVNIICSYEGGMEGMRNNLNSETFTAAFRQQKPYIQTHDEGAAITSPSVSVTNANCAVKRTRDGTWSALSTGFSGGPPAIAAIAVHPNGTVYFGGIFTNAGGSGADYAAIYNPKTNTFSVVNSATAFNAQILSIVIAKNGIVYFGGSFTNAGGIANADGIVAYDPVANSFSALSTGVAAGGFVWAMALSEDESILYAGGDFTTMGGIANTDDIAQWSIGGLAWTAMGTGISGGSDVSAITVRGNDVYIGGAFTGMGGVANTGRIARWDASAATWNAMATGIGDGQVLDMEFDGLGKLWIVGSFSLVSGASRSYITTWNGSTFSDVVSATVLSAYADCLKYDRVNNLMYVGGNFTLVDGVSYPDGIAVWNGVFSPAVGINLPGSALVDAVEVDIRSGTLYLGFNTTGTATAEAITTVTNHGTSAVRPTIMIVNVNTTTNRLYSIRNYTTGSQIFFDYAMAPGERIVLNFERNALLSDIGVSVPTLVGATDFVVTPGDNLIAVLVENAAADFSIYWHQSFVSASDAVGVI